MELDIKTIVMMLLSKGKMTRAEMLDEAQKVMPQLRMYLMERTITEMAKDCIVCNKGRDNRGVIRYYWEIGTPTEKQAIARKKMIRPVESAPTVPGARLVFAGDQIKKNHPNHKPELRKAERAGIQSGFSMFSYYGM